MHVPLIPRLDRRHVVPPSVVANAPAKLPENRPPVLGPAETASSVSPKSRLPVMSVQVAAPSVEVNIPPNALTYRVLGLVGSSSMCVGLWACSNPELAGA